MKLLTPIIMIIISAGMYYMYIDPMSMEVKALNAKLVEFNGVLDKSKEVAIQRDALFKKYNSIPEEQINRLGKIVPDTFDSVLFANDLGAMVSRYGMRMDGYKADQPAGSAGAQVAGQPAVGTYKTSTISFRLTGQYDQFIRFLTELESSLRIMDVSTLSIKSVNIDKPGQGFLEFTLSINTYSLK